MCVTLCEGLLHDTVIHDINVQNTHIYLHWAHCKMDLLQWSMVEIFERCCLTICHVQSSQRNPFIMQLWILHHHVQFSKASTSVTHNSCPGAWGYHNQSRQYCLQRHHLHHGHFAPGTLAAWYSWNMSGMPLPYHTCSFSFWNDVLSAHPHN